MSDEKCEEAAVKVGSELGNESQVLMIAKMITAYLQERHNQDWRSIRLDHDA